MHIHKRDHTGSVQFSYEGELVAQQPRVAVITARWGAQPRDLGYAVFMPQDRFTEYYYTGQWFNIMRLGDAAQGTLKGWYCNITHPATITATEIIYDDLLLDVWVRPDGTLLLLDEDEFTAAALEATVQQAAWAGVAEVQRWVRERLGPFTELASGTENIIAAIETN